MTIASRTPEGYPSHCPICGAEANIEYSEPIGDATCPSCGHLLWRRSEIVDQLRNRISKALDVPIESVTLPMYLKDLGADSLDTVELAMDLEEEFDISLTASEAEKIETIADLLGIIEKKRRNREDA